MAEIINVKVSISGANVAITELQKIRTQVDYLNKTPVKITVDTAGMEQAVKLSTEHLKAQAKLIKEQLKAAETARKEAAEQAKVAQAVSVRAEAEEKAAQAIAKTAAETKKATAAHGDLMQQFLSLRQNEEQARQEAERLYQTFQQFARVSRLHGLTEQFLALESSESRARMEAERLYEVYRRLSSALIPAGSTALVSAARGYYSSSSGGNYLPGGSGAAGYLPSGSLQTVGETGYTAPGMTIEAEYTILGDSIDHVSNAAARANQALGAMREGMTSAWAKMQEGGKLAEIMRDSIGNIVVKMAAWQVMGNIVGTVIRSLREAVSTMKEVDQELTNIQKVSDLTAAQIQKIGDSAYATASKYGVSAQEYLKAVYTFQKAGIGENSEAMAELATKTMLVGDTTAEVATQFLISANAAWKFGGNVEALSKIVDEADYINNNYATTLADIATGLPIVGATAAQVGMTAEETMAAIGTIVASTGQTASKAATALRAIIMNLLGQTGELEDGTKVTQETIDSLNAVLNKYAQEALAASQESGKLINPLEAIAALAKAAEDPLVTETELFNILAGLGGKLRTTQLAALVNNLDMANSMLDGMADSAGTADREISIMLESMNAKIQILKNSVSELIHNLVNSNAAKGAIDFLTVVVKLLDSGVSKIAAWTLGIYAAGKAVIALVKAVAESGGIVGLLNSPLLWIAGAVTAVYGLIKLVDALNVTAQEHLEKAQALESEYKQIESEIESLNARHEELVRLIEEGNEAGASEAYLTRLRNENNAINIQIGLLNAQAAEKKKAALEEAKATFGAKSYTWNEDGYTDSFGGGSVSIMATGNIIQYTKHLLELAERGDDVKDKLSDALGTLSYLNGVFADGDEEAQGYAEQIAEVLSLYKAIYPEISAVTNETEKLAAAQEESAEETTAASNALADAFDEVSSKSNLTYGTIKKLDRLFPGFSEKILDASGNLTEEGKAALSTKEAFLELIGQEIVFNNSTLDVSQKIQALSALAQQAGITGGALAIVSGGGDVQNAIANWRRLGLSQAEAEERVMSGYYGRWTEVLHNNAFPRSPSGGGGGGGSSKSAADTELDRLKSIVSMRKQELSYLDASNATTEEKVGKMREIQGALHDQAEYLRSIGASEEEILKLSTEWWSYQNKITKELEDAQKALEEAQKQALETEKEAAVGALKQQLELLKAQKDTVSEQRTEEEKLLAVEKARIALENAQRERNVRQYNAKTGQWEWVSSVQTVSQAQEAYDSAKKGLEQYYADAELDRQIKALEDKIKKTEADYDKRKEAVGSTGSAALIKVHTLDEERAVIEQMKKNSDAWWEADPEKRKSLEEDNFILGTAMGWVKSGGTWYRGKKQQAYGIPLYDSGGILRGLGGIKATREDEMILPPGMTAALLNAEQTGAFDAVLRKLGIVTAAGERMAGFGGFITRNSVGSQHNGDVYQYGNITLSEAQARGMTVYDLAQMARTLSLHGA